MCTGLNPEIKGQPTKTLFERAQEPIIVGQAAYSSAYPNSYFPTNFPWEGIAQINDQSLNFVTLAGQQVNKVTEPKGIHDEMGASFDPVYGRMSGNLGMQLPNPTTLNALLVLYGYNDLPTEFVNNSTTVNVQVLPGVPGQPGTIADGTQIWKISHNGVDTHPIHFHIFDVQLVNRVGWDGQIALPEAERTGLEGHHQDQPADGHHRGGAPQGPDAPLRPAQQSPSAQPGHPDRLGYGFRRYPDPRQPMADTAQQRHHRFRLQQHRLDTPARPTSAPPFRRSPIRTTRASSPTSSTTSAGNTSGIATSSAMKRWT